MKKAEIYETPLIETLEINIEKGFATSGGSADDDYAGNVIAPPLLWDD